MSINRRARRLRARKELLEKYIEERLDARNSFNAPDPTPLLAVKRINERGGRYGNAADGPERTTA